MSRARRVPLLALLLLLLLPGWVAAQGEGVIEGTVVAPDETLPADLEVELLFLPNGQGPPQITSQPLPADGTFRFEGLETDEVHGYLVRVRFEGEDNFSDLLGFAPGQTRLEVTLRLLERTTSSEALSLPVVSYILDVRPGGWAVVALYRFRNEGDRIIENLTNPPAIFPLPEQAIDVRFADGIQFDRVVELPDGFAYTGPFPPGDLPFAFSYFLPYSEGSQTLELPVGRPTGQQVVLLPQLGQSSEIPGFTATGEEEINGRRFDSYEAGASEGAPITVRLEGLPPPPAPLEPESPLPDQPRAAPVSAIERLPWWATLLPALLALAAVAIYVFQRPAPSPVEERHRLREQRDQLVAEIAAIDIRRESGAIGEQSHRRQREALKRQLREILRRLGSGTEPR